LPVWLRLDRYTHQRPYRSLQLMHHIQKLPSGSPVDSVGALESKPVRAGCVLPCSGRITRCTLHRAGQSPSTRATWCPACALAGHSATFPMPDPTRADTCARVCEGIHQRSHSSDTVQPRMGTRNQKHQGHLTEQIPACSPSQSLVLKPRHRSSHETSAARAVQQS
jgi:hypothetical protein